MNLVIPEAIVKLREVVAGLEADPEIQVVIFTSEVPDSQGSGGMRRR